MVRTAAVVATGSSTADALASFDANLSAQPRDPDFAFVFYGCGFADRDVYRALRGRWPATRLVGGTSSRGVMSAEGFGGETSLGAFLIWDENGDYGSAALPFGKDPRSAARDALLAALENAGCPGELPELIWIYQAPGQEEAVLEGLREIVGDRCPIIGGSSADDAVTGDWRQLGPDGPISDGIVVGVLFSSGGISVAFEGGYEPTGHTGIVTGVRPSEAGESGIATETKGRQILSIDDRPAAEVYNEWVGGALAGKLATGGSILAETTLTPLGINPDGNSAFSHYLLVHPASITEEGFLTTFATIAEGTRLVSMRGDRRRLIDRAGRVADVANKQFSAHEALAGGLVIYCGGCMMAVDDEMDDVVGAIRQSFGDAPFLGCFTFGEQGPMLGANVHGNLMISAIAFGC